jgi:mRNA interferase RelE/StbE
MSNKFEIVFIEEAKKDYQKLDGSVRKLVDVAIAKMKDRADVLGEDLTKKNESDLIGCRKIKFKQAGIRIVYRISAGRAEIAEIISIGKRKDNEVYKVAAKRLMALRNDAKDIS